MLLGVGLLHGSRIWSYEQMLLDCEIFDIVRKMMGGIVVDDETLALETIRAVGAGPAGNYLAQRHTKKHARDLWLPRFLDRRPYSEWEEKRDGPRDWARAQAQQILKTHQPTPLDPALATELERIVAKVEEVVNATSHRLG